MSFLNPIFLIALASVAVPLLIYLLNLRKPKRIAFSTLSFFSAIQQSSLRKIKIKRRLLLFLRMAAVACLALALARPQFQPSGSIGPEGAAVVGILIDNSPSMEQVDENGPWMDQAIELVSELADAYDENTRFLPEVTNGESLYQPLMSASSLKQVVADVKPRNVGNDAQNKLMSMLEQLQQAPEPNKRIIIITDGQRSQWEWLRGEGGGSSATFGESGLSGSSASSGLSASGGAASSGGSASMSAGGSTTTGGSTTSGASASPGFSASTDNSATTSNTSTRLSSAFGSEPLPPVNWIRIGKDGTSRNSAIRDIRLMREEQGYVLDIALANYGEQRAQNQLLSLYQNNELILQQPFELESQSETWVRFPVPEPDAGSGVSSTQTGASSAAGAGASPSARSGANATPSTQTQTRNYPVVQLELRIEGDEITFDDRTYWTIEFPRLRRILLVNQDKPSGSGLRSYLDAVLQTGAEADQLYEVISVPVSALTADQFQGMDAVVLNGVPDLPDYLIQPLTDHVQQGAGLLLLPSAEGNPQGYNRLIGSAPGTGYQGVLGSYGSFQAVERLASPSEGHPILDGIFDKEENEPIQLDPPSIYFYFDIPSERNRSVIPILKTRSGKTLLAEVAIGNGSLIYSAIGADPGWSDFPLKPFFAPLFHKTVQYLSAGEGAKINQHHLGTPFRTEIADGSPTDTELLYNEQVIRPDLRQTFTGVMVRYDGLEWTPGFGSIRSGDREIYFSINQSAMESDLASLSISDTEELLGTQFETVTVASSEDLLQSGTGIASLASFGKDLWHWFILLAIGFLLAESLVSRYYKAEFASGRPSDN